MKTKTLLTIILILAMSQVRGQDRESLSDDKAISVNILLGQNQIKEMNLFPLVHRGMAAELSLETEKVKNSLRAFQFLLTYSKMKTSLEELVKSGNIRIGIDYSYYFQIFQKNNLRYYAGPHTSLCYSFMLYPNWDESHVYWSNSLCLGAGNVLSVSLRNECEWFTELNFSLLGFFSRPDDIRPYKIDDSTPGGILKAFHGNIEPGLMNKVSFLNFRTEYRFPVLTGKREAITLNMDVIHMSGNNGNPVIQIINRIGLKIML